MEITNHAYELSRKGEPCWLEAVSGRMAAVLGVGAYPLRLAVVKAAGPESIIEATVVRFNASERYASSFRSVEIFSPRPRRTERRPFVAVQVIPTGVRCEFGGYAGDATPVTNVLAAAVDYLVTHPNAVNASDLNEQAQNILYVEGKTLDDFLLGHIALTFARANKIGTFVDPTGIGDLDGVVSTLNAARAVAGIDAGLYTVLSGPPNVKIEWSGAGCAVGTVLSPETILDGAALLIENGAEAVGGVSVIHGVTADMFSDHVAGHLPNPSGGIEAIITHLISKIFRLPSAHAPLPYYRHLKTPDIRNARAAAEFISTPHYFSVLKGLARAPRIIEVDANTAMSSFDISINNVHAIIAPASCLGGIPALAAEFHNIPLIAVRENRTILDVTNDDMRMRNVVEVETYLEAAGVLIALREGISLESLRRPLRGAIEIPAPQVRDATLNDFSSQEFESDSPKRSNRSAIVSRSTGPAALPG